MYVLNRRPLLMCPRIFFFFFVYNITLARPYFPRIPGKFCSSLPNGSSYLPWQAGHRSALLQSPSSRLDLIQHLVLFLYIYHLAFSNRFVNAHIALCSRKKIVAMTWKEGRFILSSLL